MPETATATGRSRRPELASVQVLRAVAALAVLAAHIDLEFRSRLGLPGVLPNLQSGASGVDLFFVISGFIMVYASGGLFGRPGGVGLFVRRRLARVVPLYWAVTTLYVVLSHVVPDARTHYGWDLILASYAFWPHPNGFPVVGVGWTLNYEMFFYLIFGLFLPLRRWAAVAAICATLIALVLTGGHWTLPEPFATWTGSIILEFVFGIGIAVAFQAGWRLPLWAALPLIATGAAALIWPSLTNGWSRGVGLGLPAAAIMAGAVLGRWPGLSRSVLLRVLVVLGDASYALYLTHAFVIRFFRGLAERGFLDATAHPYLYAMLLALAACAVAVVVHQSFEAPLVAWFKTWRQPAR